MWKTSTTNPFSSTYPKTFGSQRLQLMVQPRVAGFTLSHLLSWHLSETHICHKNQSKIQQIVANTSKLGNNTTSSKLQV